MLSPNLNVRHDQRTVNFNATTSIFNYGTLNASYNSNVPTTWLALIRPTGSGEGGFGYIVSKTISSTATGMRFILDHNAGSPRIIYGVSSGNTGPSQSAPVNSITYGRWIWVAATYAGGNSASDIKLFQGLNNLTEVSSYPTPVNGTGSINSNSSDNLTIGNRDGGDRTFAGDIALVVKWSSVLNLRELNDVLRRGPLSIRKNSILLCWAGGQDISPHKLRTSSVTARALGNPRRYPVESFSPPLWLYEIAAGVAQNISPGGIASGEAFGSAAIIPGSVTLSPSAIPTEEAFGTTVIIPGGVNVVPSGIASGEAFGAALVSAGGSIVSPTSIPTAEAFGTATLAPGVVTITVTGIPSGEAFGLTIVLGGAVSNYNLGSVYRFYENSTYRWRD